MENSVLRLLALRPRSTHEVRQFLQKKFNQLRQQPDQKFIDSLIAKFLDRGLLDDTEFARWLVGSRSKQHGHIRIVTELRKFGIPESVYRPLLPSSATQLQVAKRLISNSSKFSSLSTLNDKKRASDYLRRRGFSTQVIRSVIDWDNDSE